MLSPNFSTINKYVQFLFLNDIKFNTYRAYTMRMENANNFTALNTDIYLDNPLSRKFDTNELVLELV